MPKMIAKNIFQVDEWCISQENYAKCEKLLRY